MDNQQYTMVIIGDEQYGYIEDAEIEVWDQRGMDMSDASSSPASIETIISTISVADLLKFYIENGGKLYSNPDYNPNIEVQ